VKDRTHKFSSSLLHMISLINTQKIQVFWDDMVCHLWVFKTLGTTYPTRHNIPENLY